MASRVFREVNFLDNLSVVISIVALVISLVAACSAWRAANAAKHSAEEATKSRKLTQFSSLSQHFINVEHFLNSLCGEPTTGPRLSVAKESIKHIDAAFPKDADLHRVLSECLSILDSDKVKNILKMYQNDRARISIKECRPENVDEMKNIFTSKKRVYLNIE